jgi:hypothetical protein
LSKKKFSPALKFRLSAASTPALQVASSEGESEAGSQLVDWK